MADVTWNVAPERIVEARKTAGLSREQLAVRTECSFHTIRAWENGWRKPNPRNLTAIALATGRERDWFKEAA